MTEIQKKKSVIRTPPKFKKLFDFVELALDRSKSVNVTDNRKYRKRVIKDSRQERNHGSLKNNNLKDFPGKKEAVIEEQHNADVVLLKKIDREKDSSKLEIPTNDS